MSWPRWTWASKISAPAGRSRASSAVQACISSSARWSASSTPAVYAASVRLRPARRNVCDLFLGRRARRVVSIAAVPNLIIAGDSIRNPEIRHEVPLAVPDLFLYLERDGTRVAILNSLEVGRARALGIEGLAVRALEEFGSDEMAPRRLLLEQINP